MNALQRRSPCFPQTPKTHKKKVIHIGPYTAQKATIHQVTTMLATSKNVLFPGHNYLLTTNTDDPTLWLSPEHQRVKGHQYRQLAGAITWK